MFCVCWCVFCSNFLLFDYMCTSLPFISWSIAGGPSSQALPGYLITAPPSVYVPDVIGEIAVRIQNQKTKKRAAALESPPRRSAYCIWSVFSWFSNLNRNVVLQVSFTTFCWKETKETEIEDWYQMTLQMQEAVLREFFRRTGIQVLPEFQIAKVNWAQLNTNFCDPNPQLPAEFWDLLQLRLAISIE